MNKQMIIGACVGALLATAGGAFALRDTSPKFATIVSVTPITAAMEREYAEVESVVKQEDPYGPVFVDVTDVRAISETGQSERVCEDKVVRHQTPVQDENQMAGTATGAVIGGILGHQVGGGNGKKIATVAGVIAGGVIGKNVQANHQRNSSYQTSERVCSTQRGRSRITGYDVTYRVDGRSEQVQMSYKPGNQLPMVNGQIVTDKAEASRLFNSKTPDNYEVFYTVNGVQNSLVLPNAPKIGTQFPVVNGQLITDPSGLASLAAKQHQVVAYKVVYRTNEEVSEIRMKDKPIGTTLPLVNGHVVVASGNYNGTTL